MVFQHHDQPMINENFSKPIILMILIYKNK